MNAVKIRRFLRARPDRSSGTAAIEFGLAIPFFLILLMGVVEVGFAMYQAMQVYNSVEAGMLYASKNGFDAAGITAAVTNATGTTGITATPAPTQFCGCPVAGGISAINCNSTCANGTPVEQYIQINATLPHQTILPYPGLPLPTNLTAKSIVRLK